VGGVKRPYHAPIRQEQAARTRARILEVADHQFARQGWAGTTLAGIAAAAQVTPQAVHQSIGGKAAVLISAVETAVAGATDHQMLSSRAAFADVYAGGISTTRRLAAFTTATADIYARTALLFLALREAVAVSPSVAELAEQAGARRLADHRRLAKLLLPNAPAGNQEDLADVIWVLAGPGPYVDLVHLRSWTTDRYRDWLARQLQCATRTSGKRLG
jgi:AcrR family transcriptional regulator